MKPNQSILYSIVLVALFAGCKPKSPDHLKPEIMTHLLLDLQAAETYSSLLPKEASHPYRAKNIDSLAVYYKTVFAHYHITQQQFDESLTWYSLHPDEMDSVYNRIIPELTRLESAHKIK